MIAEILRCVQQDVGNRGLARRPDDNLFNACAGDFEAACRSLADHPKPILEVVTGFWIASAERGETDGPLGAVYLARTLPSLGIEVVLTSDDFCEESLSVRNHRVYTLPHHHPQPTHRLALERVGPSHADGRCYSMRGVDITDKMQPIEHLFAKTSDMVTLGVGDGGNEVGMGKIAREKIARDIHLGDKVACRVAVDHLIVVGISNWAAYALAAGIAWCKNVPAPAEWFDLEEEHRILRDMVEHGHLVDGVRGQSSLSVDGLDFADYIKPLQQIAELMGW
jgi:hypothetical protein